MTTMPPALQISSPLTMINHALSYKQWGSILIITLMVNYGLWYSIRQIAEPFISVPKTASTLNTPFVIYQPPEPLVDEIPLEPEPLEKQNIDVSMPVIPEYYALDNLELTGLQVDVPMTFNPNELIIKPQIMKIQPSFDVQAIQQSMAAVLQGVPLLRVPPNYPEQALARGIEGRVVVEYQLDEKGAPYDINIVDEKPKGYFRQATLRAIARWRFQVDPKYPITTRYQTEIKFEINK